MKTIDKYITKQFLLSILFGLLAFTLIFVVIDMMENLDDFIDENVPFEIIAKYYLVFIPEIIRLMIPVGVLLSSLFTVGKLSNFNELTSLKSGGISLYRFAQPFILTALIISILSIFFSGWIVPYANRHKIQIDRVHLKKGIVYSGNNIFLQDANNRILHLVYYDENSLTASRVSVQSFDSNDLTKLVKRTECDYIRWDSTKNYWVAFNVNERKFLNDSINKIFHYDTLTLKELNLNPNDILLKQRKVEELNFSELFKVIEEQKRRGNDVTKLLIDVHSIFAFSFASLIVVFFGIPLSAEKRRGGIAFQFGVNIFVTFVYLAFMKISQAFGKNGMMNPILTAWFANLVFLVLAVINIIRVKK